MTSQADFVQPPRIAVWLVMLFTPAEKAESMLGDLLEEFSQLASKSGPGLARSWYWRQTANTIAHLVGSGFRIAPWSIAVAVVGGFFLMKLLFRLPEEAIVGFLGRYRVCDDHFAVCMFWITDGILIGLVILNTVVGGIVAVVAKGREMTATLTLAFIKSALAVAGLLMMVARTGHYWFPVTILHVFAFSIATVVGGAIVRILRSAATTRLSVT
jgi:hypothetical protein